MHRLSICDMMDVLARRTVVWKCYANSHGLYFDDFRGMVQISIKILLLANKNEGSFSF